MLFNSMQFLIFLPIVVMGYYAVPNRLRHLWLLAASYYFYMCWNARCAVLILFSTVVTYLSGLMLERIKNSGADARTKTRRKKIVVALSFVLNLAILFYFKYANFAFDALKDAFRILHIQLQTPQIDVLLPVGISFYTFQALSYTMDVYRKDISAERDFLKYALFVSFFPQLVAGPIERSKNLLSQIREEHHFSYEHMRDGLLIMLWGYFQKLVLADRIAIIVDQVYGNIEAYPGMYLCVASVLFAVQIYCDFSGYSMIAIGAAKIMGFSLMENFDCPYFSGRVSEFWRKWHISLTSWFRDYLYIPLGGNRKGTVRKYINIVIVFLVSGLWHGAQWTYIIWGGLNGVFQVIGSVTEKWRYKLYKKLNMNTASLGHHLAKVICTFVLIDITWIFFRARSMGQAISIIRSIVTVHNPEIFFNGSLYTLGINRNQFSLMVFSILILIIADALKYRKIDIIAVVTKQDLWFRWLFYISAAMFILVFGIWGAGYDAQAFVYFQF